MPWYAYLLIVVFAVAILIAGKLLHRKSGLDKEEFTRRWKDIQTLIGSPEGSKMAIIEADNLVDEAMKQLRISGKTMGERLVTARKLFSDNDSIWMAHKLRNKIVHESNVRLQSAQLKDAIIGFRKALKDLGAL
jgi:hypothetical protein